MDRQVKARLGWVNLYLEAKDAGYVCIHCGISRPTLRKWVVRYQAFGVEGLKDLSKRPKSSPYSKTNDELCALILTLRKERNLGARRIQSELKRLHEISLSLATIHKVLTNKSAKPIKKLRRKKKFIRYQRPIPGDRVQIDTCKIGPGIYQYGAKGFKVNPHQRFPLSLFHPSDRLFNYWCISSYHSTRMCCKKLVILRKST